MAANTSKTKAQLLELIEKKEQEIRSLNDEIRSLEKCKRYEDITDEIKDVYDKFLDKGFADDECMTLIVALINEGQIPARMPARRVTYPNYQSSAY